MYACPQQAAAYVQKTGGRNQPHGLQEQKLESAPLVLVLISAPQILIERFRGEFFRAEADALVIMLGGIREASFKKLLDAASNTRL